MLILFSGSITNLLKEDPAYQLYQSSYYNKKFLTSTLHIPYFTGKVYEKKKNDRNFISDIEREIEGNHITNLR